jgi:hypothetical protein
MLDQYLPLLTIIAVIVIAWIALRFVLKLTARIFSCGCLTIAALAIFLIALRYFEAA